MEERKEAPKQAGCSTVGLTILVAVAIVVLVSVAAAPKSTPASTLTKPSSTKSSNSGTRYLSKMTKLNNDLRNSIEVVGTVLAAEIPDDESFLRMIAHMAALTYIYDEMQKVAPPEEYKLLHREWLYTGNICAQIGDMIAEGVDDNDTKVFQAGIDKIIACHDWIDKMAVDSTKPPRQEITRPAATASTIPKLILIPTATPAPATANQPANLRTGPSTDHAIADSATQGQALAVVARNAVGDWYQLDNGKWIAAFLVDDAPADLPVATAAP